MSKGYQLKITIKDSHPPIWRRVIVPEHITFYDLDNIIEALFGWTHSHLFEFDFYNRGATFAGNPMALEDEESDAWECIDDWMEEGLTFLYTYDFGDDWIHTVKVEKIVDYDARYPKVLKYKGPNMIEDCGGIWGFERYRDEAEEFDMEDINEMFQHWDLSVAMPVVHEDEDWMDAEYDEGDMIAMLEDMFEKFKNIENKAREVVEKPKSLTDVLACFKKDELITIAKAHGFSRYQGFKKKELAEWLRNHLLETRYMQDVLSKVSKDEITLFESAIEKNGIYLLEELLGESLFLTSYGAFVGDLDFFMVPDDVKEVYQKIVTPEFRKKLENEWDFMTWCDSVVYLYGVISVEKFTEIYNSYEHQNLSVDEMKSRICHLMETEEYYALVDGYFMDQSLLEEHLYQDMLEEQGNLPYYMPKDKEEFLTYGEGDCQSPDEETLPFVKYLEETGRMSYEEAMMLFYYMQEEIRNGADYMELMGLLEEVGLKLNAQKAKKKATEMLKNFWGAVRKQEFRGHTWTQVQRLKKEMEPAKEISLKIVQFPSGKKVYPNELCPCGSGKKYKHCCGKQK